MNRRSLLISFGLMTIGGVALAEAKLLNADEIDDLLRGNRIKGDWNGTPYSQTFLETGVTTYFAESSPPSTGRWRVNASDNTYESWWERSGWSSYEIERDGDALYWVDSNGGRHPFDVVAE